MVKFRRAVELSEETTERFLWYNKSKSKIFDTMVLSIQINRPIDDEQLKYGCSWPFLQGIKDSSQNLRQSQVPVRDRSLSCQVLHNAKTRNRSHSCCLFQREVSSITLILHIRGCTLGRDDADAAPRRPR